MGGASVSNSYDGGEGEDSSDDSDGEVFDEDDGGQYPLHFLLSQWL